MSPLLLAWTLLAAQIWIYGSCQTLEPVKVLYPAIMTTETLECCCMSDCDKVYWFRSTATDQNFEFVGNCNNANRVLHGKVDADRYQMSKRGSSSFTLRIVNMTRADAGIYSCILTDSRTFNERQTSPPGFLLRPGETPPTLPPTAKTETKNKGPGCPCDLKKSQTVCSYVTWTLEGLIGVLTLAVICTLYYFSRLPKKCNHHFVKKRMT